MSAGWDCLVRSASAGGPFDAWLAPRVEMVFSPSPVPIDAPVAKLGGQPVCLDEPVWPVSASSAEPMTFVGYGYALVSEDEREGRFLWDCG